MKKIVILFIAIAFLFSFACIMLNEKNNTEGSETLNNNYSSTAMLETSNRQVEDLSTSLPSTSQSPFMTLSDFLNFDSNNKYIICNRFDENPFMFELEYSSGFPSFTDYSKEISLKPYEKVVFFCLTSQDVPLYIVEDNNKYFLVINDRSYSLEMCPSDLLPYMDSAILVYDNEENLTSYICKLDLSNGEQEQIISDLAFERARDYIRTGYSKIVYKSLNSNGNEWKLYDGSTKKTTTFVSKGACVGFKDSYNLIFCDYFNLLTKNKIQFFQFDISTNKTRSLCSFMIDDAPAPNNIFILVDKNYVIMESSGDDFSGTAPKSYLINLNTGTFIQIDNVFPYSYIVLPYAL